MIHWQEISAVLDGIYNAIQRFISAMSGLVIPGISADTRPHSAFNPGKPGESGWNGQNASPTWQPHATASAPGKQSSITIINNNIVDGKIVAASVERHLVKSNTYPTRTPQADGFSQPSYG